MTLAQRTSNTSCTSSFGRLTMMYMQQLLNIQLWAEFMHFNDLL